MKDKYLKFNFSLYIIKLMTDEQFVEYGKVLRKEYRAKNKDILNSYRNMCFPSNCNTIRCIFYVFFPTLTSN